MKIGEFLLTTLAVFLGTLVALAIVGIYLKSTISTEVSAAASSGGTLGAILSLFGGSTTPATT